MVVDGNKIFAGFAMAFALSFHFFGYECARAASISLLAAKETGLGSEALSYVQMVGSPASALTLYLYAKSIKTYGPMFTLRVSQILCLLLLGLMFAVTGNGALSGDFGKVTVILFYAFREIYVSLISTQQWAFIASILDSSTSNYMVKFSGIVSISSAVGGCMIELLVSLGGIKGLLATALLSSILCCMCSEVAYFSAQGFVDKVSATVKRDDSTNKSKLSVWRESLDLMKKHPTLQILFVEAIFHQIVGNMLNLMFHDALRLRISDDGLRATVVGRFFATVNLSSCFLQFFVLPGVLSQATLPQVLANVPLLIFVATMVAYLFPSLIGVMVAFGFMKVIEYSVMTAATELIYMPMGKDVRYLGKELVKFFGHKLGKSGSSIFLSIVSSRYNPTLGLQAGLTFFTTGFWAVSMYTLASHLRARDVGLGIVKVQTEGKSKGAKVDILKKVGSRDKGYFDNMYPSCSSSEAGSDDCSESSSSSTSLCDIYGSEVYTPPQASQYSREGPVGDWDVGLSIDEDRNDLETRNSSDSSDTICCPENPAVPTVVGLASIMQRPDVNHSESDTVQTSGRSGGVSHRRRGSVDTTQSRRLPESSSSQEYVDDGNLMNRSNKPQKTQNLPLSNFLSIFSPQKARKQNTILRVGSEAVMFTTLIEKAARRKKADNKKAQTKEK